MSHSSTDNNIDSPDSISSMETHSIGVVVVIYNKKCMESVSFREIITNKTTPVILVDNSTDSDIQSYNREECHRIGCDYHSMEGNKGLAKAYNVAISQIGSRIDYLMLLDDDTTIPQDTISELQQAIALHPSADIFVPFVFDQATLLSPCRRWSSLFFRLKRRPETFTRRMSAINAGLVIRLDPHNREKPLFDDKMFLDCIDHDFILRRIRQGDSVELFPAEFRQNFFDQTAVSQEGQKERSCIRFQLFAKDYRYFCKTSSLNRWISELYLLFRAAKLNLRYRTNQFSVPINKN